MKGKEDTQNPEHL